MRVVAVLGGSGAATPELAAALAAAGVDGLELRLIGRDAAKLAKVSAAAQALAGSLRIVAGSEIARGVSGAEIVLNQVRVGGLPARAFDETFPREFGIPGEETLGAGGFANALRTVPVAVDLARAVEREAPDAWFVNLTNPAGIVHQAIERATALKVLSVCDSPASLIENARAAAGADPAEVVDAGYLGMNHVGWLCGLRRAEQDLLPAALEAYAGDVRALIESDLVRALGVIPGPYLRYYYHPDRMLAGQAGRRARAEELLDLERELLEAYGGVVTERPEPLARRGAAWYGKAAVPAIAGLLGRRDVSLVAGRRNGEAVGWLPPGAVVELPSIIRRDGVERSAAVCPPGDVRALLQAHAAFEELTVEGVLEQDDAKLLRALVANPMIPSSGVARAVLRRAREFKGI